MSDQKARDIIDDLSVRGVCGERVRDRVGRRAWSRPRVAVSDRLYKQYRVPDPWDPEARQERVPVGLGPVSLRLGEKRRQPAPHLKPRAPKAKKQGLAERARADHRSVPKAAPKPKPTAPKPPPTAPPARAEQKAAEEARSKAIAERMRRAEAARGKWVRAEPTEADVDAPSSVKVPIRPDIDAATLARRTAGSTNAAKRAKPVARTDAGRFRMKPRPVIAAPVVTSLVEPDANDSSTPEVSAPEPPALRTRAMPSATSGSMDDLFAAAAQMGRLSLRENEPDSATREDGDG